MFITIHDNASKSGSAWNTRNVSNKLPRISVVLATYNSVSYLGEAIHSILDQIFRDFELIIIDDGSSDGTSEILDGFNDQRIIRLRNEKNLGVAKARNRAGAIAKGEYIAVHDADDLSMPERFAKQVAFLDDRTEVGVVGTQGWLIALGGKTDLTVPLTNDNIQSLLLGQNCLHHSSLMIRAAMMKKIDGYDESYSSSLDLDLVLRLAEITDVSNLPERLYVKRTVPGSITSSRRALIQKRNARRAIEDAIERRSGAGIEVQPHKNYALNCLAGACAESAFGSPSGIEDCLRRALDVDPQLEDNDNAARVMSDYSINYAFETGEVFDDPLRIIGKVFEHWPDKHPQDPLQRKARALALRSVAFTHYRQEKWTEVIVPATRGFLAWPNGDSNKGLLSICLRAILKVISDLLRI